MSCGGEIVVRDAESVTGPCAELSQLAEALASLRAAPHKCPAPTTATAFELHDDVAVADGGQAVRDNRGCVRLRSSASIDSITDSLGHVVERARGFVQHQHACLLVQGARDTDALALPAGSRTPRSPTISS